MSQRCHKRTHAPQQTTLALSALLGLVMRPAKDGTHVPVEQLSTASIADVRFLSPVILTAVSKFAEGPNITPVQLERRRILDVGVAESLGKPTINRREEPVGLSSQAGVYRDRHGRRARDAVDAAALGATWLQGGLHGL
jgi:hypothetical protein